ASPPPPDTVPDLGAQQSAPERATDFIRPVPGAIIRGYAPGRNEGIAIGSASGTDVRAAAAGTVAAITRNTEGVQIVVIRHADNLLTVYTHLDNLTIQRDQSVTQGQVIGKVAEGDPSFLHFEIRRGMESVDPLELLP
ncbi:MAG: M23 family metallopeptidase, partial [Rubellimicrobium sp.]|nr:M23 family metallopeptidase [Rubellimicrobium sp.]